MLKGLFIDQMKKEEKTSVPSIEEEKHVIERLLNCFSGSRSGAPTHKVMSFGVALRDPLSHIIRTQKKTGRTFNNKPC